MSENNRNLRLNRPLLIVPNSKYPKTSSLAIQNQQQYPSNKNKQSNNNAQYPQSKYSQQQGQPMIMPVTHKQDISSLTPTKIENNSINKKNSHLKHLDKRKQETQSKIQQKYQNTISRQQSQVQENVNTDQNERTKDKTYFKTTYQSVHQPGGTTRRLKQARDSLKITHEEQNILNQYLKPKQRQEIKARELKKVKSMSSYSLHGQKQQKHDNYGDFGLDVKTVQKFMKQNLSPNYGEQTVNKNGFFSNNNKQQYVSTSLNKTKSYTISKSKSQSLKKNKQNQGYQTTNQYYNNGNYVANKNIQERYQLKTKKLAKRPLKSGNKNIQYENALLSLETDVNNQPNLANQAMKFNATQNPITNIYSAFNNFTQMLAKRPQAASQSSIVSNAYMKNYKNMMDNPNIYRKEIYEQEDSEINSKNTVMKNSKNGIINTQQIIQECVETIEKQVIDRYVARTFSIKQLLNKYSKKKGSYQNIEDECSDHLLETDSGEEMRDSRTKDKQKDNEMKAHNKSDEKNKIQPDLQLALNNIMFAGLGICQEINIVIKKTKKQSQRVMESESTQQKTKQKYIFFMNTKFQCKDDIYWFVHKMPENIMQSNLSITENIMKNIPQYQLGIITVQNEEKIGVENQRLKSKLLYYIKTHLTLVNKGLGFQLTFKQSSAISKASRHPNEIFCPKNKITITDLFKKMSDFSRIYLQDKQSLQILFSEEYQCNSRNFNEIRNTINFTQMDKDYQVNEDKADDDIQSTFSITDTLKVLYITFQKKEKKSKNKKSKSKSKSTHKIIDKSSQKKQPQDILNEQQIIEKFEEKFKKTNRGNKIRRTNPVTNKEHKEVIKRCVINENNNTLIESRDNSFEQSRLSLAEGSKMPLYPARGSLDNLLVPVIKYIMLGQTQKPKHKLKTIITKTNNETMEFMTNESIDDISDDSDSNIDQSRCSRKRRNSKNYKYGMLTPYFDDESTIKIRNISTNIYAQIIGEYFMAVGKRKNQKQKKQDELKDSQIKKKQNVSRIKKCQIYQTIKDYSNKNNEIVAKDATKSNVITIPQDVMLSLKYYLMIPNHFVKNFCKSSGMGSRICQNMKSQTERTRQTTDTLSSSYISIIDRFFEKLKYSFIVKLDKNQRTSYNQKNYIINVSCYRLKKLYRTGFEKFYMLKFEINERNARTRMDQFILTSYDISKHFQGLQIDLDQFINEELQIQESSLKDPIVQQETQNRNKLMVCPIISQNQTQTNANVKEYDSGEVSGTESNTNYSQKDNNFQKDNKNFAKTQKIENPIKGKEENLMKNTFAPINSSPVSKKSCFIIQKQDSNGCDIDCINPKTNQDIAINQIIETVTMKDNNRKEKNMNTYIQIKDIESVNSFEFNNFNKGSSDEEKSKKYENTILKRMKQEYNKDFEEKFQKNDEIKQHDPEEEHQDSRIDQQQQKTEGKEQIERPFKTTKNINLLEMEMQSKEMLSLSRGISYPNQTILSKNMSPITPKSNTYIPNAPQSQQIENFRVSNKVKNHTNVNNVKINLKTNKIHLPTTIPKNNPSFDLVINTPINGTPIKKNTSIPTHISQTTQPNMNVSSINRLTCPENLKSKQFNKIYKASASNFMPITLKSEVSQKSMMSKRGITDEKENDSLKDEKSLMNEGENSLLLQTKENMRSQLVENEENKVNFKSICKISSKKSAKSVTFLDEKQKNKHNIVECLKQITQRISIYKTKVYTRIGIESLTTYSPKLLHHSQFFSSSLSNQTIIYHANRFRFSRNKYQHFSQQFLSPHLKSLEIVFQKTTKIECDNIFAILTVLKVKYCTQFYIKIYLPSSQKTMSFSITHRIFEYFSIQQLKQIFEPMIQFNYQCKKTTQQTIKIKDRAFKTAQEVSQESVSNEESSMKQVQDRNGLSQALTQEELRQQQIINEKKYMIDKIEEFFIGKYYKNKQKQQISQQQLSENKQERKSQCEHSEKCESSNKNNQCKQNLSSSSEKLSLFEELEQTQMFKIGKYHESQQCFEEESMIINKNFTRKTIKSNNKENNPTRSYFLVEDTSKSQLQTSPCIKNKQCEYKVNIKKVWANILKHLKFERRSHQYSYRQFQQPDKIYNHSYLIAKLGEYEGFIKDFSMQEYIYVQQQTNTGNIMNMMNMMVGKNTQEEENKQYSIVKIEISMQQKIDGLNYVVKDRHTQKMKKNTKINKRRFSSKISQPSSKLKSNTLAPEFDQNGLQALNLPNKPAPAKKNSYIYQSQTSKQIIYISISDAKTNQKICYSYYLCQLLHLIDNNTMKNNLKQNHRQNLQHTYKVQCKQFKQMLLNYAVLFKILNYIKNQYIIELQNSSNLYIPKLYRDSKIREQLKHNVDKILLGDYKTQREKQEREERMKQSEQEKEKDDILCYLMGAFPGSSLNGSSNSPSRFRNEENTAPVIDTIIQDQLTNKSKNINNVPKITFNSRISHQKHTNLLFLTRKVVPRKGYPIFCLFYNQPENKFKIFLSNYKKGTIKQIQIPLSQHPMPFINIANYNKQLARARNEARGYCTMKSRSQDFLLAFRNRLLKYHHNTALLASI